MARFEDSPDLFGRSPGISTCGDFTCSICGTRYNTGNDENEDYDGDSIEVTTFAGAEVCGNCFERIEKEILRRMTDILSWYKRLLLSQKKDFDNFDVFIKSISEFWSNDEKSF
ncbi:MAG: hypothetical protein LBH43_15565 [Treponema sp.]|nr:hypothetical protein [Treponema sp.]